MGFFDLNIPYEESSKPARNNPNQKQTRMKLTIKAMELGYTGVAYNRTISGVMSDHDSCTISRLSLSSLLKFAPSLSSSVKLHRDALGVPVSSPFRQYTRLTVSVDSVAQVAALNSGNPILKTYDLVAVRPMNQNTFEQACQVSEVDIIAIDFSERLPFMLKLRMVKAAMKRGIYFEITYNGLIADIQTRRQMISKAKLLVDWTQGKNLILSSAVPSVNELRGPYDVANLMSLLGLSMERAKAAISKNCRTLLANALKKKQCYKEAIRIEAIPPDEQRDAKELWYDDWLKWDPISSGEGDLLLEDMAKSFAASSKITKTVKAIDFSSIVNSIPSHGLQLKDLITKTKTLPQSLDDGKHVVSAAKVIEVPIATNEVSEEPRTDQTSLTNSPSVLQTPFCEHSHMPISPKTSPENLSNAHEIGTHTITTEEDPIEEDMQDLQQQNYIPSCEPNVVLQDLNEMHQRMERDIDFDAACTPDASTPSRNHSALQDEENESTKDINVVLGAESSPMEEVVTEADLNDQAKLPLASNNVSLQNSILERKQVNLSDDVLLDERLVVDSYDETNRKHDCSVAIHEQLKEVTMEEQEQEQEQEQKQREDHTEHNSPTLDESATGKGRGKQRTPQRAFLFPFKRLLNPIPFKKKARKFKNKIKSV